MKNKKSRLRSINNRNGLLFALPWIIGFCFFVIYPFGSSLYYSFCDFDGTTSPFWIGIANYKEMLFNDDLFWISLYNTVYYVVFAVTLGTIWSISLALLLNIKIRGQSIYRTIYYVPAVVPIVASSVIWLWILNPLYGIINNGLAIFGIKGPGWLAEPMWSKPALVLMGFWGVGGAVVIYLAGLQGIPENLYESAEIDGATVWHKILYVTLPMLSPAILFNVIMGVIGGFQYFTQAFVMTGGGPANTTLFYSLYLYNNAFVYFRMGYGCALAWVLFSIIMTCTFLIFRFSGKYVYYLSLIHI